jgi:predicted nucleic acid-binding protein
MTVVDASLFVNGLVTTGPVGDAARHALGHLNTFAAPSVFPAEVASALRSLVLRDILHVTRAKAALARLAATKCTLYPFAPFSERVWELRENLSVYDAWYVALAERLSAALLTSDARLARAVGPRCPMRLVADRD